MDARDVKKLLLKLQVGWPRQIEVTDSLIEFWLWGLADVPYEVAEEAARLWVSGGKPFPPQVSDLRAIIADKLIGDGFVPEAVWSEVKRQALRFPYGVSKVFDWETQKSIPNPGPTFSHPLIAQAVEATGWKLICHCDEDNETTVKAQFTKTLQALTERAARQIKTADLSGGLTELAPGGALALNGRK